MKSFQGAQTRFPCKNCTIKIKDHQHFQGVEYAKTVCHQHWVCMSAWQKLSSEGGHKATVRELQVSMVEKGDTEDNCFPDATPAAASWQTTAEKSSTWSLRHCSSSWKRFYGLNGPQLELAFPTQHINRNPPSPPWALLQRRMEKGRSVKMGFFFKTKDILFILVYFSLPEAPVLPEAALQGGEYLCVHLCFSLLGCVQTDKHCTVEI